MMTRTNGKRSPLSIATLCICGALGLACGDDDGSGDGGELEIIGVYDDNYGGQHEITATEWTQDFGTYHIESYDNGADYLVAHNDADNEYDPDKWSRFDWTETDTGRLFFCQVAFAAASAEEAENATEPDRDDPTSGGCGDGDFPWTELLDK